MKQITPGMLRTAADIMEHKHPFERYSEARGAWIRTQIGLKTAYKYGEEVRLALATPPVGELLHNPHGLNADQVGCGFRLISEYERTTTPLEVADWWTGTHWYRVPPPPRSVEYADNDTYRVPLSVPWPVKPDPWAKLKAAWASGKQMQYRALGAETWLATSSPSWIPTYEYREAPEPEVVDLCAADILPGSVLRHPTWDESEWCDIGRVRRIDVAAAEILSFRVLREDGWLMNQSMPRTGAYDPGAWELCHKQKV